MRAGATFSWLFPKACTIANCPWSFNRFNPKRSVKAGSTKNNWWLFKKFGA